MNTTSRPQITNVEGYEIHLATIRKNRAVPTVREVLAAAKSLLWVTVDHINVGSRKDAAGSLTDCATQYGPSAGLEDTSPLKYTLQAARRGDAPRVCDLYVYEPGDIYAGRGEGDLLTNLTLVVDWATGSQADDDWYLTRVDYSDLDLVVNTGQPCANCSGPVPRTSTLTDVDTGKCDKCLGWEVTA